MHGDSLGGRRNHRPGTGQNAQQPANQQPSFVIPAQAPQTGFGGGPAAISGGS
jgi:hypothetical protein